MPAPAVTAELQEGERMLCLAGRAAMRLNARRLCWNTGDLSDERISGKVGTEP